MKRRSADIESQQRATEFYQEENARLMEQVGSLLERIGSLQARLDKKEEGESEAARILRESFEKQLKEQKETYEKTIAELRGQLADMSAKMDHMAEANAGLASQISDLVATATRHRSKRFAPSTEKRDLLNSKPESRAQKEEESDGGKDDDHKSGSGAAPSAVAGKSVPKAAKSRRRNPEPDGETRYDTVIDHFDENPIPENAHVVEGADGSLYFDVVTVTPARLECHRYHYRRYVAKDPDTLEEKFGDTLPDEVKELRAAPRCVLRTEGPPDKTLAQELPEYRKSRSRETAGLPPLHRRDLPTQRSGDPGLSGDGLHQGTLRYRRPHQTPAPASCLEAGMLKINLP